MEISKEDFMAYESVRKSGLYNMFDERAIMISGLSKEKYMFILSNYAALMKTYPDVRKDDYEKE